MVLTREHLASPEFIARARALVKGLPCKLWSDDALRASVSDTLATSPKEGRPEGGIWVFGYGSLIWNPIFPVLERFHVTLNGYERGFFLKTIYGRGTPENPGLVLALDEVEAAQVCGVAMRLPAENLEYELFLLWRREMLAGSYKPVWVNVTYNKRCYPMLTFVVDISHKRYAGKISPEERLELIRNGHGILGSARDYFWDTKKALDAIGLKCAQMEFIAENL